MCYVAGKSNIGNKLLKTLFQHFKEAEAGLMIENSKPVALIALESEDFHKLHSKLTNMNICIEKLLEQFESKYTTISGASWHHSE